MHSQRALLALAALLPLSLAQISDGFESGWNTATWPVFAPDCNQGGSVTLDSTTAHTGTNSLKVVGGSSGYCGHIFFGTTQVPTGGNVYVRTWFKHTTPIPQNHETFIIMPDSGLGTNEYLRLSGQEGIFEWNRESDDATLPSLSPQGVNSSVGFPTGTWECIEYHLGSDGTLEAWFNDQLISGMTVGPAYSNPNAGGWGTSYKPKISAVYFGFESYSGGTDTVWYDDIVIAASRIGCSGSPPPPPSSTTSTPISTSTSTTSTSTTKVSSSTLTTTTTTKLSTSSKPTCGTVYTTVFV